MTKHLINPTRRQSRYGRLHPAPRWRTTEERLAAMEELRQRLGLDKTQFQEAAVDCFLAKHRR